MIVVVPPKAAARVPVSKVSFAAVPPNGSSIWVCTSIAPGMTHLPVASRVRSASTSSSVPMSAMRSPSISTSAVVVASALTIVPPLISVRIGPPWFRSADRHRSARRTIRGMTTDRLHFTGDAEADRLLVNEPMALLIGFALDQQVPVQKAFSGPKVLLERLGTLDARELAEIDSADL